MAKITENTKSQLNLQFISKRIIEVVGKKSTRETIYRKQQCIKMAGGNSMKLFQFNRKYCQTIGIKSPQSNTFNAINWIFVVCVAQFALTSAAFMLFDANSMGEYGVTFVAVVCAVEAMAIYTIIIWKLEDISKFIEKCEAFIEDSE